MAQGDIKRLYAFLLQRDVVCIAAFEIEDARTVAIRAVRHQREDDYH